MPIVDAVPGIKAAVMVDFWRNLFDTADFPARWNCGNWSESLGWLHIMSDLMIFAAYAAIPAVLTLFVMRRRDVPFPPIFWLFALFILSCGTGHLIEATLFWHPWYRLSGLVKLITAGVSWAAVLGLARVLPQALALPGLARINSDLQSEVQERRRAEDRFRIVVEAAPSGIILVDAAGRINLINSQAELMFGYTREELIGQPIERLVPDRVQGEHPRRRQQYFQAPTPRLMGRGSDLTAQRKDGSQFPVEIGLNPLDTADGPMVLSVIVDISDRKRAEDAMQSLNRTLALEVDQRTRLALLLHDIAAICNQAESVDEAIRNALTRLCAHLRWPLGHAFERHAGSELFESSRIWVHLGTLPAPLRRLSLQADGANLGSEPGWIDEVCQGAKPRWIERLRADSASPRERELQACGVGAVFALPIIVQDETRGVIEIFSVEPLPADEDLLSVAQEVGRLLGLVVERFELQRAIADSIESEQRRIAAELHDGLGQELTAMSLLAKSLERSLSGAGSPAADKARELAEVIPRVVRQTRSVVRGLMPVEMDAGGLMSALQQTADATEQRSGIVCRLDAPLPVRVDDTATAHHLFRIAQEAVNNAVKHSGATRIDILLRESRSAIVLQVSDNGRGGSRNADGRGPGMGLRIMKHRANLINATFSIGPSSQGGTTVTCRLTTHDPRHSGDPSCAS